VRPSTHFDDLAPASARRAHDASNRNLQSTNVTCAHVAARCARFGRAGPRRRIRRAPLAGSRCLRSKVGVACRRRTVPNRRGAGSSRPNDSGAAAKRHPRHRSAYPDGDRSIRPRVDASHLSAIRDSRRERREPPFQPCVFFTDGWFRVPRRVSSPKGAGTRGHSITSVITTATRARRRRPYPRETLDVPLAWPPRIVFCCGRLRLITRERPPVAGGAPLLCFPIPFARELRNAQSECGFQIGDEVTQHLSSSLMAPVGCGDTLRTASSPCSTEGLLIRAIPRRTARTASPRCPPSSRRASMRARLARDRTLLRGAGGAEPVRTRARLPGMPFRPRRPFARRGENGPEARWGEGVRPSPDRSIPVTRLQRCEACGFDVS